MRGVLLCGGEGTRLRPFTEVINKHLVRVHDLPMAEYPLLKMIEAGIREVMIVSGGENFAAVVKYFGSGKKWGIDIIHSIQDESGGIAQALGRARTFIGDNKFLVCLGDNIWSMNLRKDVEHHLFSEVKNSLMFMIKSSKPERFGVLKFDDGVDQFNAIDIVEKPKNPPSDYILAGIYAYGPEVFSIIEDLKPSGRGELEITDVNRAYIKAGKAEIVRLEGWWSDCGTLETLLETEERIKDDRVISSASVGRSNKRGKRNSKDKMDRSGPKG